MGDRLPPTDSLARDDLLDDLAAVFAGEMPKRVAALCSAWISGDGSALRRLAHQLRGASAGYGFPDIGRAAGALEDAIASVRDPGDADDLLAVRREFDALVHLCTAACRRDH